MLRFQKKEQFIRFSLLFMILFYGCHREELVVNSESSKLPVADLKIDFAFDKKIGISWNDADYSGDYYIFMKAENDTFPKVPNFNTSENYFDAEVDSYSTTYFFTVKKKFNQEFGESSNVVSAKAENIYRPLPPYQLRFVTNLITDSTYQVVINWDNQAFDLKRSEIYKSDVNDFQKDSSTFYSFGEAFSFTDTTYLSDSASVYYSILLEDDGGLKSDPTYPLEVWLTDYYNKPQTSKD